MPSLRLASAFLEAPEYFPYPVGGAGSLWRGIHRNMLDPKRISVRARVVDIDAERHVAHLSNGERVTFEHCISSALIRSAMQWGLKGTPKNSSLVVSRVHIIRLGFRSEMPRALVDKSWSYSPEVAVLWYRATVLSNYLRSRPLECAL